MNKHLNIIAIISLTIYLVICFSVLVKLNWTEAFDLSLIHFIQGFVTAERAEIIVLLTDIGGSFAIILFSILTVSLLFLFKMYTAELWFSSTLVIGPGFLVSLMKRLVDRERPDFLRLAFESSESFPSGHSTASTVFFGLLGILLIYFVTHTWQKYLIGVITIGVILFVMTSRIFLGVHFPTDVLAGLTFGIFIITLSLSLYFKYSPKLINYLAQHSIEDKSPSRN